MCRGLYFDIADIFFNLQYFGRKRLNMEVKKIEYT